jgi:hypothetical protein
MLSLFQALKLWFVQWLKLHHENPKQNIEYALALPSDYYGIH